MRQRKFMIGAAIVTTFICYAAPLAANHAWRNYHWERSSNPFSLDMGDNLSGPWPSDLSASSQDWNSVGQQVISIDIVPGSSPDCTVQLGNIQACNGFYGNNGWLGIAGIAVEKGKHIVAGYVKVNDTYFASAPYNQWYWRQYVMCQEAGHTFGLGHVDEDFNTSTGSCMDYGDPIVNLHPDQHDSDMLQEIYLHLDGSSEGDGGGGNGGSNCNPNRPNCPNNGVNGLSAFDVLAGIDAEGPAQWGRLVSGHGPQEVYEIDLGQGRKIVTFVTWTLAAADNHEH